jgi:hypothetical protein
VAAVAKRGLKEIKAAINSDRSLFRPWRRDIEPSVFIYETIRRPERVQIPAAPSERSSLSLNTFPPSPVSERASKEVVYRSRGRLWRFTGHLSNSLL